MDFFIDKNKNILAEMDVDGKAVKFDITDELCSFLRKHVVLEDKTVWLDDNELIDLTKPIDALIDTALETHDWEAK